MPENINEILKETLDMFLFLGAELTILFLLISYLVGILQLYISKEKVQSILSSKNGKGYIISAFLGSITPFCSCSTIPFLKGLIRAKAGFGPMMVFLFASPLLNPIIIGLFVATFGIKVTAFYFVAAMTISIIAGYVLEKLKFEKYIKSFNYDEEVKTSCCKKKKEEKPTCCTTTLNSCGCNGNLKPESYCSKPQNIEKSKWLKIWDTTWADFKTALPYLLIGITLGSFIYGFAPTEFIAKYTGEDNPLAIPFAAIIGIPLYIRAEAVIPLSAALISKGMGLGTAMSLIIGSAGASITELILLKSIFKKEMIIAFCFVILGMAMISGYLLNIFM